MKNPTVQAILEWRDGLPYSPAFDDVYFSSDNGLLETEYVFIQGNALTSRWQLLASNTFTILETGFGTGLNFLCACKAWLEYAPAHAVLYFTSVEKFPLSSPDMHKALLHWQTLQAIADELLAHYDTLLDTGTVSLFNDRIRLQVLFGDATASLSGLNIQADAWFLDGFAPAKNPEMWQPALFEQMARLSCPGTTLATFTSAGIVKRGLKAAGFTVIKKPGFGRKREMITGHLAERSHGS